MKILILDDMKHRHSFFKNLYKEHDVTSVFKFNDFCEIILKEKFDIIHLDHDLGDEVIDPDTYFDSFGYEQEFTGAHAAMRLGKISKEMRPEKVIIHSINESGAKRIFDNLKHFNFEKVFIQPFDK